MKHKISCIIPIHERELLLPTIIQALNDQTYKLHEIICVGQTDSERQVCEDNGAKFYYHRNTHLGAKWQFGVDIARNRGATEILYVGSGDYLSKGWVKQFVEVLDETGGDMIGMHGGHYYKVTPEGDYQLAAQHGYSGERSNEPYGAGRLLSNHILEELGWHLFDYEWNNSLDHSMYLKVIGVKGKIVIIDIRDLETAKCSKASVETPLWVNKHSLDKELPMNNLHIIEDTDAVLDKWFPRLRAFNELVFDERKSE